MKNNRDGYRPSVARFLSKKPKRQLRGILKSLRAGGVCSNNLNIGKVETEETERENNLKQFELLLLPLHGCSGLNLIPQIESGPLAWR